MINLLNLLKKIFKVKEDAEKEIKKFNLEEYYNTKYPIVNISYNRTDKLGTNKIDVRQFLNPNNFMLPTFIGDDDTIAFDSLNWIIKNIKYIPDSNQYKHSEYWAFGYETLNSLKGDCEDGSILLYEIMRKNGIPSWKIRVSAGFVLLNGKLEGHCYLTYYCEEKNKWVVLDWCYWPNNLKIFERKDYKEEENYKEVWFSFNENYSWTKGLNENSEEILNDNN